MRKGCVVVINVDESNNIDLENLILRLGEWINDVVSS